jgi:hypothetical protein
MGLKASRFDQEGQGSAFSHRQSHVWLFHLEFVAQTQTWLSGIQLEFSIVQGGGERMEIGEHHVLLIGVHRELGKVLASFGVKKIVALGDEQVNPWLWLLSGYRCHRCQSECHGCFSETGHG